MALLNNGGEMVDAAALFPDKRGEIKNTLLEL